MWPWTDSSYLKSRSAAALRTGDLEPSVCQKRPPWLRIHVSTCLRPAASSSTPLSVAPETRALPRKCCPVRLRKVEEDCIRCVCCVCTHNRRPLPSFNAAVVDRRPCRESDITARAAVAATNQKKRHHRTCGSCCDEPKKFSKCVACTTQTKTQCTVPLGAGGEAYNEGNR